MPLVTEKRPRITGPPQLIAVMPFHVHRAGAQEPALDKSSHAPRDVGELIVVPHGYFEPTRIRERNQSSGIFFVKSERLLYINVGSPFQAQLCKIVVAFRRGRDVD